MAAGPCYKVLEAEVALVATDEIMDIKKSGITYDNGTKLSDDVLDVVAASLVKVSQGKAAGSPRIPFSEVPRYVTVEEFATTEAN